MQDQVDEAITRVLESTELHAEDINLTEHLVFYIINSGYTQMQEMFFLYFWIKKIHPQSHHLDYLWREHISHHKLCSHLFSKLIHFMPLLDQNSNLETLYSKFIRKELIRLTWVHSRTGLTDGTSLITGTLNVDYKVFVSSLTCHYFSDHSIAGHRKK